jgi:hypothetical protein
MSTVNLLSGMSPLIQVLFAAGVRRNDGAYKHSADQGMPDVQALEVRRPRRFLPTATTGSAPVRPHSPLEPPRDPGERLGRSFRADDAALTRSRCRTSASKTALAQADPALRGLRRVVRSGHRRLACRGTAPVARWGNSARSTCRKTRTWNGHAASWAIQPQRSRADYLDHPAQPIPPPAVLSARLDETRGTRTEPSCCDAEGRPPIDPGLVERFEHGLRDLGRTLPVSARTAARRRR